MHESGCKEVQSANNYQYLTLILDMRLALPRDVHKKSMIPLEHPVNAEDVD